SRSEVNGCIREPHANDVDREFPRPVTQSLGQDRYAALRNLQPDTCAEWRRVDPRRLDLERGPRATNYLDAQVGVVAAERARHYVAREAPVGDEFDRI